MHHRLPITVFCAAIALLCAAPAWAQSPPPDMDADEVDAINDVDADAPIYESTVSDTRMAETDATTGTATAIDTADATARFTTVAQTLRSAPGTTVRQSGGLGSYSEASIRGSAASQVPVYLDGVRLNGAGFPAVDLSSLALDNFSRIDVYRSGAPMELGPRGLGGAILLHTRPPDAAQTELALSFGTLHTRKMLWRQQLPIPTGGVSWQLGALSTRGDFPHLNDNGTWHDPTDDHIAARRNNGYAAAHATVRLEHRVGAWHLRWLDTWHQQQQGLAGMDSVPTRSARHETQRNILHLAATRPLTRRADLHLSAAWHALGARLDDAASELGSAPSERSTGLHVASLGGDIPVHWSARHTSRFRLGGAFEHLHTDDSLRPQSALAMHRLRLDTGLSHDAYGLRDRLRLTPTLQLELTRDIDTAPASHLARNASNDISRLDWLPGLGACALLPKGFELCANAGRYVRVPDLIERFGNRGTAVGNSALRPESGVQTDAGLRFRHEPNGRGLHVNSRLSGFAQWTRDLIVWVPTMNALRPENLDAARTTGLEAELALAWARSVRLEANYTFLHAVNTSNQPHYRGRQLPGRPAHELWAKLTLGRHFAHIEAALYLSGEYIGQNPLSPYNDREMTVARLYANTGASLHWPQSGLTLSFDVYNLADRIYRDDNAGVRRPLRDYEGFPLPGRTAYLTIHWRRTP
ncbi:MAG: TonB-dependent receptor [Proteobacteria bacterium]|nr:TonB-dependent receptor [Pseudomonadota bacterium]